MEPPGATLPAWRRDTAGNCYTWAFAQRWRYGGVIRWRRSTYIWWLPHAAWSPDGRDYWSLVPANFTQRDWIRTHWRPPLWFIGRVVRDFKSTEGVNL